MKRTLVLLVLILSASGCGHVPTGKAKGAGVKFGVAPIFKFQKEINNIAVSNDDIRVGDTKTIVNILNFEFESWLNGAQLPNPKP